VIAVMARTSLRTGFYFSRGSKRIELLTPPARLQGFTIVELLIVVVVIAILASISVVAYAGIQERTKTSLVNNAAGSWMKAVNMQFQQGFSPPASVETCLGRSVADFPEKDGFQAGECLTVKINDADPVAISYTPEVFDSWGDSIPRPDGLLPVTTGTFRTEDSTLVYRARGIVLSTYSATMLLWVPLVAQECGPGQGNKTLYIEHWPNVNSNYLSGDLCIGLINV